MIYWASGYKDVKQNLVVSETADTTASKPPSVNTITENTYIGHSEGGKGEVGTVRTSKNKANEESLVTNYLFEKFYWC